MIAPPLLIGSSEKWCECCKHDSAFIIDWIFLKLAGNQNRHKISDEFDIQPDRAIRFGVIRPWVPKKYHRVITGKCCKYNSTFISDWILVKFAGNHDRHTISNEFEFWPDPFINFGVICPLVPEKCFEDNSPFIYFELVCAIVHLVLVRSAWNLQITRTGSHCTIYFGVTCPWLLKQRLFNRVGMLGLRWAIVTHLTTVYLPWNSRNKTKSGIFLFCVISLLYFSKLFIPNIQFYWKIYNWVWTVLHWPFLFMIRLW